CQNFWSWKKIQLARSPVSPSGIRRTPCATRAEISRKTVWASARLTPPLKWTPVGGMEWLLSPATGRQTARCEEVPGGHLLDLLSVLAGAPHPSVALRVGGRDV